MVRDEESASISDTLLDLDLISDRPTSSSPHTSGARDLRKPFTDTLKKRPWPSRSRLRSDGTLMSADYTIDLSNYLRAELKQCELEDSPSDIIRLSRSKQSIKAEIWTRIETEICQVVFGSNMIEDAGTDYPVTFDICKRILRGEKIDAADIEERSPEYAATIRDLKNRGKPTDKWTAIRSRREVIQHVQAFSWAIDHLVLAGEPFSEYAIKTIHEKRCDGSQDEDNKPGVYRSHEIAAQFPDPKTGKAKKFIFIRAKSVPEYMKKLVENINTALERQNVDPYDLAAQCYHHFVNIHPFGDGNGRTSRIILNCLCMTFTGHLVPIGEDDEERQKYLEMANRASRVYHEEDGEVDLDKQKGHREVAKLMVAKSVKSLKSMLTWATLKG